TRAVLDDRNWKRPVFSPDIQSSRLIGFNDHAMHLVVSSQEILSHILIGHVVAGMGDFTGIRAEDTNNSLSVARLYGVVQSQSRVPGRGEGLFVALLGKARHTLN